MMEPTSWSCIKQLEQLLRVKDDTSDSEDDLPQTGTAKLGPGHIGSKKKIRSELSDEAEREGKGTGDKDAIWGNEEVVEGAEYDDYLDPRKEPEYDIKYKQAVTPEDLFLQMGGKTPGTASCEDMVVSVKMAGETMASIDLNVTKNRLDIRARRHRLGLPLPHPVDPDASKAEWDEKGEILTVTLRMNREFDFVNL